MARKTADADAKRANGATVCYEARLWPMADALRGSIDALDGKTLHNVSPCRDMKSERVSARSALACDAWRERASSPWHGSYPPAIE